MWLVIVPAHGGTCYVITIFVIFSVILSIISSYDILVHGLHMKDVKI